MSRRKESRDADDTYIANGPTTVDEILTEPLSRVVPLRDSVTKLDEFLDEALPYDRRRFSFGEPERYTLEVPRDDRSGLPATIMFGEPRTVAVCARRKERKEVLIAKRRKGRGGGRRNQWSDIRCR